jgi:hypothetical protein
MCGAREERTTRRPRERPSSDAPRDTSRRWLRFRPDSHPTREGEFLFIEVMGLAGAAEEKLCEVIVTREQLLRALDTVKPRRAGA